MDPFSLLGGVLSCIQAIFDAIDKVHQADAAEHEAFKELKRTVADVEDDIKFFKTMISVLGSSENEDGFSLFMKRFVMSCCPVPVEFLEIFTRYLSSYYRQDAKCAMKEFHENLHAMTILLDTEPAAESSTPPNAHRPLKLFLQSLIHLPSAGHHAVASELKEARIRILDNRQKIKRAFRLLWNLYIISQQQSHTGSIFSLDQNSVKSVAGALDAVSWDFIDHPFAISRLCGSFSLSVLNRDHNAASKKEELSRKLGKGWIDGLVNRHHVPANQLIDVQITLFELIWSGTIQQLRGNPTRSITDPEHRESEQILDQLDSSLQEVIARSRRPRFTLSFYGMVKAGKSLFLNALIGKIVLPSNGKAR